MLGFSSKSWAVRDGMVPSVALEADVSIPTVRVGALPFVPAVTWVTELLGALWGPRIRRAVSVDRSSASRRSKIECVYVVELMEVGEEESIGTPNFDSDRSVVLDDGFIVSEGNSKLVDDVFGVLLKFLCSVWETVDSCFLVLSEGDVPFTGCGNVLLGFGGDAAELKLANLVGLGTVTID